MKKKVLLERNWNGKILPRKYGWVGDGGDDGTVEMRGSVRERKETLA